MATEKTTSIPGILPSLAEEAKKLRDFQKEERDRENQEKEDLESKRLAESRQTFLEFLDKYAGAVLRQLDVSTETPIIENATSNWFYHFRVAHTVITLVTPETIFNGRCSVGVSVKGGYFGDMETKWINQEKVSDFLLSVVADIVEQYQQYRFLAAELDQYNACLKLAALKTQDDIASDKASLWTWPDRAILNLYKITWTKGGYYDSDDEKAYIQYEHGWSLSDRPDNDGYFDLLTPTNSVSYRKLKVQPNSIELVSISRREEVPIELIKEVSTVYDIVVAPEISMCEVHLTEEQILDYKRGIERCDLDDITANEIHNEIHIVFPEHLPRMISEEIPNIVVFGSKFVELGKVPCLKIRLAVEAIASGSVSAKDDEPDYSPL